MYNECIMKCDEMKNNVGKKVALAWSWKIVKRRLGPDAELFQEGDLYCKLAAKYIPLDTWKDLQSNRFEQFCCGLANCTQTFDSLSKYESHYNSCHRNVCQTCHRILPSAHLLDLHILETHDVMFTILAEKQDMYQCLLESCSQKFRETMARRDHMVKVHKYPSNYRYDRSEHKRAKKNSSKIDVPETMETESTADGKLEQNVPTSGRIFSYKVPKIISFGQGASRGFLGGRGRGRGKQSKKKHWHNMDTGDKNTIVDINNVDMSELSDALS